MHQEMFTMFLIFCLLGTPLRARANANEYEINLPPEHMAPYFTSHPGAAEACKNDDKCPYKKFLNKKKCWGYEGNCTSKQRYLNPVCNGSSRGWSKSKKEHIKTFFTQGDFGYIEERKGEFTVLCEATEENDSFLECVGYTRFCRARNIMFDFKSLVNIPEPMRYREDVIQEGQVGGHCKLKKEKLKEQGQHKSPLQSWYAELEHFAELSYNPVNEKVCDVIIDKPTFIMKLDATVNMYHHFCDFINLYASLHLNDTFTKDIYILVWDTVCFLDAVLPLLPRMIFGMYYNMPLIPGCERSGLFLAFVEHVRHRLKIKAEPPVGKIRITMISRGTQYRKILNEDELISAMEAQPEYVVQKVNFNRNLPFLKQLQISYNTDILIGIHGAGLTHMLFMPEWGTVFEIYNCDDENCYADLARLRGLRYLTWQKSDKLFPEDEGHHPTLGAHAKFTNYAFDVKEFMSLLKEGATHVRSNAAFQKAIHVCKGNHCYDSTDVHNEL